MLRRNLSRGLSFIAAVSGIVLFAGTAGAANVISYQFALNYNNGGVGQVPAVYSPSYIPGYTDVNAVAGAVSASHWNINYSDQSNAGPGSLSLANGGVTTIMDSSGLPTALTGTYNFPVYNQTGGTDSTPDQQLFSGAVGIVNFSGPDSGSISLSAIPYATYDVLVYLNGRSGDQGTLSVGAINQTISPISNLSSASSGFYQEVTPSDANGSYAEFDNLSGGTQTISLSTAGPYNYVGIAGFQIVQTQVPEPASLSLLAIGGIALGMRRRRAEGLQK